MFTGCLKTKATQMFPMPVQPVYEYLCKVCISLSDSCIILYDIHNRKVAQANSQANRVPHSSTAPQLDSSTASSQLGLTDAFVLGQKFSLYFSHFRIQRPSENATKEFNSTKSDISRVSHLVFVQS